VYVIGYIVLMQAVCAPPADADALCRKAVEMWPFVVVVPATVLVILKFRIALREMGDYKAQKGK
jgi:hypothetical protein